MGKQLLQTPCISSFTSVWHATLTKKIFRRWFFYLPTLCQITYIESISYFNLKKNNPIFFFFSCVPQIILTLPFASVFFFLFFSSSAFNWEQSAPAFVCFSILYCVWVFFFFTLWREQSCNCLRLQFVCHLTKWVQERRQSDYCWLYVTGLQWTLGSTWEVDFF